VLAGRSYGAGRGVNENVGSTGNGGETEAESTPLRRRETGGEHETLRVGPLKLIL